MKVTALLVALLLNSDRGGSVEVTYMIDCEDLDFISPDTIADFIEFDTDDVFSCSFLGGSLVADDTAELTVFVDDADFCFGDYSLVPDPSTGLRILLVKIENGDDCESSHASSLSPLDSPHPAKSLSRATIDFQISITVPESCASAAEIVSLLDDVALADCIRCDGDAERAAACFDDVTATTNTTATTTTTTPS